MSELRPSRYYDAFLRDQLEATKARRRTLMIHRPSPEEKRAARLAVDDAKRAVRRGAAPHAREDR